MAAIRAEAPGRATLGAAAAANAALVALAVQAPRLAVAVVAVALVVALALMRPGIVLLACVFGLVATSDLLDIVAPLPHMSLAGFEILLTDVFLATMLLAWVGWELRRDAGAPPLAALAREPAFAAWVVFMTLGAYDLARGGYGTLSSTRLFAYSIAVPLTFRIVRTTAQLRLVGLAMIAGGIVTSATAVAMVASGRSVTEHGLSTGGVRGLSIGGSFLVAGALLCVLAAVVAGARVGAIVTGVVLVLTAGVIASGARETWIGVACALGIYVVASSLGGSLRLVLVLTLAGLIALGAYVLVPHPPRLADTVSAVEHRLLATSPQKATEDPSVQVRYQKWQVVWDQLKAHPVLGTGFGYPATYTSNIGGDNFVRSYVDDPENTHLWLWARMGTLGFAAWVALNLMVLWSALALARGPSAGARSAALWSVGLLVVIWAGMTFSPVSAFASTLLLYWFAVALVPVARRLTD